jgi:DNA-binding XRE family transcriptional regulator
MLAWIFVLSITEVIMLADNSIESEVSGVSRCLPSSRLKPLLRHFRERIDPNEKVLGPQSRLPWRRGKPVTQEELAECIGVSRYWYGMLESERPVRVSTILLDRLATILMLTVRERAMLFALALPELDFSHLEDRTQVVA